MRCRGVSRLFQVMYCNLIFILLYHITIGASLQENGVIHDQHGYLLLETEELNTLQTRILEDIGEVWDFWKWPLAGTSAVIFSRPGEDSSIKSALRNASIIFTEKHFTLPQRFRRKEDKSSQISNSFTYYPQLDEIYDYMDHLAHQFPEIVKVMNIGSTGIGQDMKVLRISNGGNNHQKPVAFIDAGIHGREWISSSVALFTIFQLVENYTANKELVNALDWYILPVLNPDGYGYTFINDRFWKKTWSFNGDDDCFGVDMDRNFPYHWGEAGTSEDPCSLVFGGYEPLSEPETCAMVKFVRNLGSRLRLYLSLRNSGPALLYPWSHTTDVLDDEDDLRDVAESAVAAIEAVRGTKYTVGSTSRAHHTSSGTSTDWVRGELGVKYVYAVKLPRGDPGFDPPPEEILPVAAETFEAIKILGRAAIRKV